MARGGVHLWRGVRRERPRRPDDPSRLARSAAWWPPSRREQIGSVLFSGKFSVGGLSCAGSPRRHAQGDRGGGRDDRRHERGPGRHRHAGRMGIELLDQRPFLGDCAGRERLLVGAQPPRPCGRCAPWSRRRAARGRRTGGARRSCQRGAVVALRRSRGRRRRSGAASSRRKGPVVVKAVGARPRLPIRHADRRSQDDRGGRGGGGASVVAAPRRDGCSFSTEGVPGASRRSRHALVASSDGRRSQAILLVAGEAPAISTERACSGRCGASTRADVSSGWRRGHGRRRNGPPRGRDRERGRGRERGGRAGAPSLPRLPAGCGPRFAGGAPRPRWS